MFLPEKAKETLKKILECPEFKRQIEFSLNPILRKRPDILATIVERDEERMIEMTLETLNKGNTLALKIKKINGEIKSLQKADRVSLIGLEYSCIDESVVSTVKEILINHLLVKKMNLEKEFEELQI